MSLDRTLFHEIDREQYDTHIRRLNYDDRDCIMYENMLKFLWDFIIGKKPFEDAEALYQEFTRWNMQMIEKVLYHDHSVPYANIRRCYQSIADLLQEAPECALEQVRLMGKDTFSYDGMAPKTRMDAHGRIFRPMSKLFIIYNIAKYYKHHGMLSQLQSLEEEYAYAFTRFGDPEHQAHDRYLEEQMEILADKIIYPIEEKVYKIPWGPKDFYLYFDQDSYIKF